MIARYFSFLTNITLFFLFGCNASPGNTDGQYSTKINQNKTLADSQNTQSKKDSSEYLISPGKIGKIKTGMLVTDLNKLFSPDRLKPVAITREGTGFKAYEIRNNPATKKAGLLIEEICEPDCRVRRVQVMDKAYRTQAGIGIGSTLSDVKKHYTITYLGSGETEIVAVAAKEKLTFLLDVSKLPAKDVPWLNLKNMPDSVKLLGMYIL